MVTDRTQADVTYAKGHPDSRTALKGAYNYTDLNRVESKVDELQSILRSYDYFTDNLTVKTNWTLTDKFTPNDAQRYLSNVKKIRDAFPVLSSTPAVPGSMQGLTYQRANDIEQVLVDVEFLINNMIASFYYSGEVNSGEVEA